MTQEKQALYRVEAYDLATFLQGVQDGVRAGYELDFTKNETYPFGSIGHYIVQLVPAKDSTEVQKVQEGSLQEGNEKESEQEPAKRGRKAKG